MVKWCFRKIAEGIYPKILGKNTTLVKKEKHQPRGKINKWKHIKKTWVKLLVS